jgi:predicted unusual protein kinase regulating ubiquinone biosynthesis (AarF/ABC1/UbiB family)
VTHHPKLGILDFGSIRVFPESLRRSYLRLAEGLLGADREEIIASCRALDYLADDDPPEAMVEILQTLLEPLLEDCEYDFARYRSLDKAIEVATVAVENGLYRTPGHRVFLVRALAGLEAYVKQLGTVANWRRIFGEEVAAAGEAATDAAARRTASRQTR